jgi:tRNA-2-methylthio-N6-dimethylallyladenosine synthase
MARSYVVRTFGCQMNEHDSERIAGLLEDDGLVQAASVDEADLVVLNTCCIRENADNKLYGNLGQLKRWKDGRDGRQIVVAGCLAQKDRELVRERAPQVDVVLGTHNVHRAAALVGEARRHGPVTEVLDEAVLDDHTQFPSALPVRRDSGYSAWVTIQIGCDNSCAFCIVPAVRGREMSRPFDEIVQEVESLAADGVSEITLLGQNVNSYGRDLSLAARRANVRAGSADGVVANGLVASGLEPDRFRSGPVRPLFAELLRAVGSVPGIRRVRYTSPHPKDLRPDTVAAMAETPTVCNHLHLPLQAGSDRVLAAMHRGYTAARYLERLAAARHGVPDLAVSTDLIVGFPGETDDDFEQTLEVVAAAEYDYAYTFIFSPRPGTEAARSTDRFVSPAATRERFERLRIVVERSALGRHRARVGRTEEVLVEGPSKKDASTLTGRTSQNKLVHFRSVGPIRSGSYALVEVTDAAPHHLSGRLVEVTQRPVHRTHIAVAVAS